MKLVDNSIDPVNNKQTKQAAEKHAVIDVLKEKKWSQGTYFYGFKGFNKRDMSLFH